MVHIKKGRIGRRTSPPEKSHTMRNSWHDHKTRSLSPYYINDTEMGREGKRHAQARTL